VCFWQGQSSDETKAAATESKVIPGAPVTDVDGNTYRTVIIGDLEWMAENLKTKTYSNGESIDYPGDRHGRLARKHPGCIRLV
jgi:hypothetical protein